MNFESENILVNTFLSQSKVFIQRVTGKSLNRHYVLKEFDSGYGVADIVLGSFTPYLSKRSIRSSIDSNWVGTLVDALKAEPFSVVEFADKCGVSQKTAREKINQFVAAGFLKSKQHRFSKYKEYKIAIDTSIAIEAKLKNWKHAVEQARRYKRFANYSYVLLDKKYSSPAEKNIHIFHEHDIGLISMNGHEPTIHYSPEQRDVPENMYFYKLNEVVHNYFKETYGYFEESGSI